MNLMALYDNFNPQSKNSAITEVVLMLIGAYLLGYLTKWLLCRYEHTAKKPVPPATSRKTLSKKVDDLTVVEGIGPAINKLLHSAGIKTFADLAGSSKSSLKKVLDEAGARFRVHDPSSWPKQARLARDGKTKELDTLKKELTAGRK